MSDSTFRPNAFSVLAVTLTAAALSSGAARAELVFINNGYHFQQTPFYCGPGAMEMMLDSPAVTGTNANVAAGLATAAGQNAGGLVPAVQNGNIFNVLPGDYAVQNQLYGSVWGAAAGWAFAYGIGSPPAAVARVMNTFDGPGNGGVHNYANWNFSPNLLAGDLASRTVAAALQNFGVPATVAVETGAHWIDVNGVSATGTVAANGAYKINGFFVRDPWTGLARNNPGLASLAGVGLGTETYLRYGLNRLPGGGIRLAPWFKYFNPTGAGGQPPRTYSIVVEPFGPELPDTIDPNATLTDPTGGSAVDALASVLTQSQAAADAGTDLAGDTDLNSLNGLSGGALDTSSLDDMFITLPGDISGAGDFLIPYDGAGGTNDVSGALLIDVQTGLIDEAYSLDFHTTLSQLDTWALDQQNGLLPQDNLNLPEPATIAGLLTGLLGLGFARRPRVGCG